MYPSKFVAIKKGNKLGTTFKAQSFKPDFTASKLLLENVIKNIVKSKKIIDIIFFFKEIMYKENLEFFILKFSPFSFC